MGDSLLKRIENTFHRAHQLAGICSSPTLEQVKDLLEHAEAVTKKAKYTTGFANQTDALGKAGEALDGAVEKLNTAVEKGSKVAGDVSAGCEISEAVSVLMNWNSGDNSASNEDAAKAFDKLFHGSARYFAKLPFPANQYAKILEALGKYNFFRNMRVQIDPNKRPGWRWNEVDGFQPD